MVSATHKRRAAAQVVKAGLCSVRRACRFLNLHRSSFRYECQKPTEWQERLHARVEALSFKHPRLGYKKLARMLVSEGWSVGKKQSAAASTRNGAQSAPPPAAHSTPGLLHRDAAHPELSMPIMSGAGTSFMIAPTMGRS
jgi:hypothetical protein